MSSSTPASSARACRRSRSSGSRIAPTSATGQRRFRPAVPIGEGSRIAVGTAEGEAPGAVIQWFEEPGSLTRVEGASCAVRHRLDEHRRRRHRISPASSSTRISTRGRERELCHRREPAHPASIPNASRSAYAVGTGPVASSDAAALVEVV